MQAILLIGWNSLASPLSTFLSAIDFTSRVHFIHPHKIAANKKRQVSVYFQKIERVLSEWHE